MVKETWCILNLVQFLTESSDMRVKNEPSYSQMADWYRNLLLFGAWSRFWRRSVRGFLRVFTRWDHGAENADGAAGIGSRVGVVEHVELNVAVTIQSDGGVVDDFFPGPVLGCESVELSGFGALIGNGFRRSDGNNIVAKRMQHGETREVFQNKLLTYQTLLIERDRAHFWWFVPWCWSSSRWRDKKYSPTILPACWNGYIALILGIISTANFTEQLQ